MSMGKLDWRAVRSREDLSRFIGELADDLEDRPPDWQNPELDMYLDSMSRWLLSLPQLKRNLGEPLEEELTWSLIARLLYAGKVYE
jgi:hypothetical protein